MRTLFIITCIANIAFAFGTLPWMPEKVKVYFGAGDTPHTWISSISNAMQMSIIVAIIGTIFLGGSLYMAKTKHKPERFFLPYRNYWMNEENRLKTIRRVCFYVEFFGFETMPWCRAIIDTRTALFCKVLAKTGEFFSQPAPQNRKRELQRR